MFESRSTAVNWPTSGTLSGGALRPNYFEGKDIALADFQ